MVYIYTLSDQAGIPFYVGSTKNPEQRALVHRSNAKKCESPVYKFISGNSINFTLDIIDECDDSDRFKMEGIWIEQLKAWGFMLRNVVVPSNISWSVDKSREQVSISDSLVTYSVRPDEREIQIVQCLSNELKPKDIAKLIEEREVVVVRWISELRAKYSCKSYVGLVSLFFRNNLIS